MKRAWFHQVSVYRLTDTIFRARVALTLRRLSTASRDIRRLLRSTEAWAVAVGRALHGCLLVARGELGPAAAAFRVAVRSLDAWNVNLYAAAARYRLARVEDDSRAELAAVDELLHHGVRAPSRLIASLLPIPKSC